MAVVIRLARIGKKGERKFRIVVKEKRSRRDGDAIETLGWFEKNSQEGKKKINLDRYNFWIKNGAIPSPTVASLVK